MAKLRGIRGVKIPVTDLERSTGGYGEVFGFVVEMEFNDPDGLEIHVCTDSEHGVDHGDRPGYGGRVGMAG